MRLNARVALAILASALWNAAASAEDDAFAQAVAHYKRAQWQEACGEFQRFLGESPDHTRAPQARFYYGEALSQLNRLDEARAQFGQLLEQDPSGRYARQALYRRGEAAYLAGDREAARTDLELFAEKYAADPLCARAVPYLASIALEQGNGASAETLFLRALAQHPAGPLMAECRLGLARAMQLQGKRDEARRLYRELIKVESPIAAAALLDLGTLDNVVGEHEAALNTFKTLQLRFPDYQPAKRHLGIGYALVQLNRHAEAEKALAVAMLDPQLGVEAGYWRGTAQKAQGNFAAAVDTFTQSASIDEKHRLAPACAFEAGDGLIELKDLEAASRIFERALARWPADAWSDDFHFGKLRIAAASQDHVTCVAIADEFLTRWPQSPLRAQATLAKARALVALKRHAEAGVVLTALRQQSEQLETDERAEVDALLAQAQAAQGQLADAEQSLQSVRGRGASDATLIQTALQVAEAAYEAGDFERAARLFADLTKSNQAQAAAWSGLGWSHYRQNLWQPAADAFKHVVDQFPSDERTPEAALMAGISFEQLEQADGAIAMYDLVAEKYAESDRAAEALWRLGLLQEKTGARTQAAETYARLAVRFPKFEQFDAVLYRRARLLAAAHQEKEAAELFARICQEFPRGRFALEATLWLAEHALANEQIEHAAELLAAVDATTAAPSLLEHTLFLEGQLALARQKWDQVEPPLTKLLAQFPAGYRAPTARYLIAEAAFRRGDFERAAELFSALNSDSATSGEAWAAMAQLRAAQSFAQLKRWSDAEHMAGAIGARFPNFERQHEADYLVGRCRAAAADFEGARQAYHKAIDALRAQGTETQAIAAWMLAETYFHQEDYAAALTEYERLDTCKFPRWHAAALLQSGKCREQLGQWSAAVETYERLLKQYPDCEFSAEAGERRNAARNRYAAESATRK
jgi:TolA-binding protein